MAKSHTSYNSNISLKCALESGSSYTMTRLASDGGEEQWKQCSFWARYR